MAPTTGAIPPPVTWAQRSNLLYIVIEVECKDIEHKVTENSFYFKGTNALDSNIIYEVTMNFLHPVLPDKVNFKNIARCLEFTIYKKDSGDYWPRLTENKNRLHFLKPNFAKWKSENDDEGSMDGDDGDYYDLPQFKDLSESIDSLADSDDNIPSLSCNNDDDDDDIPSLICNDEDDRDNEKDKKSSTLPDAPNC